MHEIGVQLHHLRPCRVVGHEVQIVEVIGFAIGSAIGDVAYRQATRGIVKTVAHKGGSAIERKHIVAPWHKTHALQVDLTSRHHSINTGIASSQSGFAFQIQLPVGVVDAETALIAVGSGPHIGKYIPVSVALEVDIGYPALDRAPLQLPVQEVDRHIGIDGKLAPHVLLVEQGAHIEPRGLDAATDIDCALAASASTIDLDWAQR